MEKPITIKDIAKKLGLSTSTVSRALSDSWEIKKETKELVIKTAAELNYHPNTRQKGWSQRKVILSESLCLNWSHLFFL